MEASVHDYLVRQCGLKPEYATRLIAEHQSVLLAGENFMSFASCIANEILDAETRRLGIAHLPEDWEGFDPHWTPVIDDK